MNSFAHYFNLFNMKTITKFALAALIFFGAFATVQAQSKQKFGHINTNDLLLLMPERANAEKALQEYAKQLEAQLTKMSNEYQTKLTAFQANQDSMTDLVRQTEAQEIAGLEQRIMEFRGSAQESLQTKESELLNPMVEKARKAIQEVAKENNYTYVFDSGTGVILHSPDGDNIMPLVKTKLGIK